MKNLLMAGALAALVSCGSDGGSGGFPSPQQVAAAQQADAASQPTTHSTPAATNAIVDTCTAGATTSRARGPSLSRTHARVRPYSQRRRAVGFDFTGRVDVTVDFDAPGPSGADRFPNATGRISASASGSVSGSPASGSASYSVLVTFDTDCSFTDPMSGASATVAAGGSYSYGLDVAWSWTDSDNWSVSASSSGSISGMSVTVVAAEGTYGATVSGGHEATASISKSGGVLSVSASWTGSHEVVLSSGLVVVISRTGPGSIYVTVAGITFGPYSLLELLVIFGFVP